MSQEFEKLVFKMGVELLEESRKQDRLFLEKNWWYQKMLSWTMQKQSLKTSLFRFIDVLPNLSTDEDFLSHWREYFKDEDLRFVTSGVGAVAPSLLVKTIRKQITNVAKMFITGSHIKESLPVISKNWEQGFAFSLDILGEEVLSEKEAESYFKAYLSSMEELKLASWSHQKTLQNDLDGEIPTINLSVKLSALFSQVKLEAWDYSKEQIKKRLRPLMQKAITDFCFINVDMEDYHHKDLYTEVFKELLMEEEFKDYPHFGTVLQAYLKESLDDLKAWLSFCKKRKQKMTIRLVKGAYWDSEYLLHRQKNWPIPVWTKKEETDLNFEKALALLFQDSECVKIAIGSHNVRSIACALAQHKKHPEALLEFQFLYGMAEGLAKTLKERGYLTRFYCTMGELIPGMSYLVRRLLENSANQSFILNSLMTNQSPEELLSSPEEALSQKGPSHKAVSQQGFFQGELSQRDCSQQNISQQGFFQESVSQRGSYQQGPFQAGMSQRVSSQQGSLQQSVFQKDSSQQNMSQRKNSKWGFSSAKKLPFINRIFKKTSLQTRSSLYKAGEFFHTKAGLEGGFTNFPVPDFSKKQNRELFQKALQKWESRFPVQLPLPYYYKTHGALNSTPAEEIFLRKNPNKKNQIISKTPFLNREQTLEAIEAAYRFFPKWKATSASQRVIYLKNTAELLKENFFSLASLQVYEVGKTWEEASADVAEAIDFCSFYAESYESLSVSKLTDEVAGEESFLRQEPIGLVAVIAPWNFPLAILTGMLTAPLVCGNTVLVKPAEQSSLTAYELISLLLKAGFPKESFVFLPGRGEEVGEALVEHPKVSVVSFTGSLEVGQGIFNKISSQRKGFKRVVLEMGGKNAIVIDSSADLDLAVRGVIESAFGFQGQKCSACSRVILLENIYEKFLSRWIPAIESLMIGEVKNPAHSLGALVDENSAQRVKDFLQKQKEKLIYKYPGGETSNHQLIAPTVYLTQNPQSDLMQKELFAPVVVCFKAKTIDEAIDVLNQTPLGLTAGLYSRHPGHIEIFKSRVEVGNVYINRNCTGAVVKRHPFGGRKHSGLGSKAGQADYLKQFLQAKVVTENQMRRGFSPELFK